MVTLFAIILLMLVLGAMVYDVYKNPGNTSDIQVYIKAVPNKIGPEGYVAGVVMYLQLISQKRR
mgnify:CR=1 FL=1